MNIWIVMKPDLTLSSYEFVPALVALQVVNTQSHTHTHTHTYTHARPLARAMESSIHPHSRH